MADELSRKLQDLACKENLSPDFNDLLKSTATDSNSESERRQLLEAINNYVGDDPLKPWVRFIKWAKDLGLKSEMLPLLECCTQRFLDDPRYLNDLRFLRIWIRYADCCPKPVEVFEFLEKKKIGRAHSLYYEAYAVILEVQGDFVKADEVYRLGTAREAQPAEQLQKMYRSFLKRKAKGRSTQTKEKECSTMAMELQGNESSQSFQPKTLASEGQREHETKMASMQKMPLGDETIAIKRYAEEAIVLGIDPEAATMNVERHTGLVDPTINTKEAMQSVLSLFNQPLPLEQAKKPRTRPAIPPASTFEIYVDEAFAGGNDDKVQSFQIFEDDNLNCKQHSFNGFSDSTENCNPQGFRIFSDENNEKPTEPGFFVFQDDGLGDKQLNSCAGLVDDEMSRNFSKQPSFPVFMDENVQPNVPQKPMQSLREADMDSGHQRLEVLKDDGMRPSDPADDAQENGHDASCSNRLNPWDEALIMDLLKTVKPPLTSYKGFHSSNKKYGGNLKGNMRNKTVDLGNSTYHLKGCTGQGAFAQVYQADDGSHNETVVLKIQRPPCPWEFYIYCQLDKRIPPEERKSFGHAYKMHAFQDCSIMVADYGQHGTLQDVINSYLAHGQKMDELLCMYYTIEMLRMLETLHSVDIIHGDFKPDNLLIRNDSDNWSDWGPDRPGGWKDQGLRLIDWGRSIDMSLFPAGTEFVGDSNTTSFRCIEMIQGRPWTFQVDTYGLCGIVHCMLHGTYMEVQQERSFGGRVFKPRSPLKRYWNTSVWDKLFKTLLNVRSCDANPALGPLRAMLEKSLLANPSHAMRLKELLMKQTLMLYAPRR